MTNLLAHDTKHFVGLLGRAELDPLGPVVAGSHGTWTLTYTVGTFGIDEGGTIKLARRFASDWQVPQFDRPGEAGYTTVRTTGRAKLAIRYDPKGHHRPWNKCLVIDVYDGSLAPGDTVTLVLGDRTGGSPGIRAQSFQESAHEWRVFVDPTNACQARTLPDNPQHPVVADEAVELKLVVPTQATVGDRVPFHIRGQDRWGNPTTPWADVTLRWEGSAEAIIDAGTLTPRTAGVGRVTAERDGVIYSSNPIEVHDRPAPLKRYWGDLHAQTDATVGTGTETEYFTFARDVARLDFTSHQGNDFQMTDADWQRLNDTVRAFHADGHFVVFPGYEWSANTPAGGDRNVFYLEEDMPIIRSSAWQLAEHEATDHSANVPVSVLFDRLRELDTDKVLCGAHVGGRYADIARGFDDAIGPLVEVVSCWGVFDWLLHDALDRGHIVAVMCNSDGHKGRPGAEGPGAGDFGIAGGLTCVLAESLTRKSIFAALKQRRCYGTTGARMLLDFTVDGQPMGSVMPPRDASLHVRASVVACGPVERLTLYRGRSVVHEVRPLAFSSMSRSRRVRLAWAGSRIRGRGRRVIWDGALRADGCRIIEAHPYSFDSPSDGITSVKPAEVIFRSRTTGDVDGLDLVLDDASRGTLTLASAAGTWTVDLAQLADVPISQPMGGVDLMMRAERYPEAVDTTQLAMEMDIAARHDSREAYFVKAVQCDGHTAWSSPIYLGNWKTGE